ncbi:4-hydroxy-tetrahydrodipicolinate synthase [Catalinimonas alkaloidigena]|uniref:4-hydroxy-tetrahydrodipicolinate synthase n=1 Tax=Catalinimonas alkaloidigena TaxID=1075417 RepID=A0A1G9R8P6_9BACT|nr:dihydrodipicolinate synthase family protein [Catalinimonas alkaloidigena]SDM19207.1 4-hydroxy-tetrahydrodipicolinate synthase [Catalinimonas alkaloidigena]
MKKTKKYQGVVVPVVTPLTADLALDAEAVGKIFEHLRRHACLPFILGTTGEAASLPASVKLNYVKRAAALKQSGEMLYAGIASNSPAESVELAKAYFDAGIDVAVAHLPSYYALSADGMRAYFEYLADRVPGPLIIYNITATTHMSIPLAVLDQLSQHDTIVGVKDSERSEERLQTSLRLWANRDDFSYFLGWAAQSAQSLLWGSDGIVPSTGNLHPGLYQAMVEAVDADDADRAFQLQKLSDTLGALYQQGRLLGESLASLKALMAQWGLCQPHMMPPLRPVASSEALSLHQRLQSLIAEEGIQLNLNTSHV